MARYTRLTKENVIAILDGIEGLEFLASYNPDGYAPYNYVAKDDAIKVTVENNSVFLGVDIQEKNIISTDRKDIRNFAC